MRFISTPVLALSTACSCGSEATPEPQPLAPVVPTEPWVPYGDMPECHHVKVEMDCEDGWCTIPAGCFVMGSPETEWGRGINNEHQRTVILSRSFELMQHEFTLGKWHALGLSTPARSPVDHNGECLEPSCPVNNVSWYDAIAVANTLSRAHDPPLSECYDLSACSGQVGAGFACTSVAQTVASIYECDGYRLPTEFEWEYAARAGTQTAFYAGDIEPPPDVGLSACFDQDGLNDTAWYCRNSDNRPHPVGRKRPNGWGLHDVIGNMQEWTHSINVTSLPPGPVQDLGAELGDAATRAQRGGMFVGWPMILRVADRRGAPPERSIETYGFRLARTLMEN